MEEMVVNFLSRISFLLCESKDKELQSLVGHVQWLIKEALELWPRVNWKLAYMEKLLQASLSPNADPSYVMVNGMQALDQLLTVNPLSFVTNGSCQLRVMVPQIFKTPHQSIVEMFCGITDKILKTFPGKPSDMPKEVGSLVTVVQQLVEEVLVTAAEAASKPGTPTNHTSLAAALSVLTTMAPSCPEYMSRMTMTVLRVANFHARSQTAILQQQGSAAAAAAIAAAGPLQPPAADAGDGGPNGSGARATGKTNEMLLERFKQSRPEGEEPRPPWASVYSSWTWNIVSAVRLLSRQPMILQAQEFKKLMLHTVAVLIAGGKSTPQAVHVEMLEVIKLWLMTPDDKVGHLSVKETVLFLQRLAHLERNGATAGGLKSKWEKDFLDVIQKLCNNNLGPEAPELPREMFQKVERVFLLGLRACDPTQRAQFLELYNQFIDSTSKPEEGKLFKRLQFIIHLQDWEALSSRFWLSQCLDLMLSILVEDEAITLAPNSAQIPPLLSQTKQNVFNPSRGSQEKDAAEPKAPPAVDGVVGEAVKKEDSDGALGASALAVEGADKVEPMEGVVEAEGSSTGMSPTTSASDLPPDVCTMLADHSTFLEEAGRLKVRHLVRALREVVYADSTVAYHCWVLIFPIVWATLQKENQVQLAKPLISLLSKEYHFRQAAARPNVVQALLEGISLSQPQPKIPSELIKYLGKTYNAWHTAIPLLESHVMLFPQETRCFDALAELYKQLSENDVLAGLWKKRCKTPDTRVGLSCIQHGRWEDGQRIFHAAITRAASSKGATAANKGEQSLWVEQWLVCAQQLNQWDSVIEYARDAEQMDTLTDCLWKLPDWSSLKTILGPKAPVEETADLLMIKARMALQEGNVTEAQELMHKCTFRMLRRWWQLPDVGIWPALPLLEGLQPLVELHESSRVLMELSVLQQQRTDHLYSDLKDIMETWRLRLPNEWESLIHWGDVLIWRNHIYNIVINALNDYQELLPQLHQLGYRDKAWSVNQLGAAARKQLQYNVCISSINKLYGYNRMDVQEAFAKIREQAKAYLAAGDEITTGLNLITTTNLEYFTPEHQAELFRLKGLFYEKLNEHPAANNAFSTALTLHHQLPEGWLSWAEFNDSMYTSTAGVDKSYLEPAAACYLQAIRFGSPMAFNMLPRVLYLLSFENAGGEVAQALDRQADLPVWTFLIWIPQLLMSLQRPEVVQVKRLLAQLAVTYPQALYYSLRTFLLTLRETSVKQLSEYSTAARAVKAAMEKAKAAEAAKAAALASGDQAAIKAEEANHAAAAQAASAAQAKMPDKPPEVMAFEAGREVMEALRSKHSSLVQVLETLLTDIGSRFVPRPAERLLAVVHMLLHRCYKAPCSNIAEVPVNLKKELGGVCKACFSEEQVAKHGWEMKQHQKAFLNDLDPESSAFPKTLGKLVQCLKGWKATLHTAVEDFMPEVLHLEDESRSLQDLSPLDVEMPGQYLSGDHTGSADQVVKLERIGTDVHIIRRHGSSYRRLKMYGSDGHVRYFLVQTPGTGHWSTTATSDERLMQFLQLYNKLLLQHPESRRRHLTFHTPAIVGIWPQVRLLEEEPSYCSCGEAYEVNCARYGREPDLPIIHFKDRCCSQDGQLLPDANGENRLQAYKDIECNVVSENVLSQYMYKTLPSCNHLWTFKKQFCSQLGLSAVLCHMMHLGGRSPNKILFTKASGRVFQMDLYPVYDNRGLLECNEPVPFRLTRNLVTFFTPFGIEGVFASSMAVSAAAGLQPRSNLRHVLSLFFRDDIMSAQARKLNRPSTANTSAPATGLLSTDLKVLVQNNVEQCLKRITTIAPSMDKHHGRQRTGSQAGPHDPQSGTTQLLDAAMNPKNLCRMEPTWHPWF